MNFKKLAVFAATTVSVAAMSVTAFGKAKPKPALPVLTEAPTIYAGSIDSDIQTTAWAYFENSDEILELYREVNSYDDNNGFTADWFGVDSDKVSELYFFIQAAYSLDGGTTWINDFDWSADVDPNYEQDNVCFDTTNDLWAIVPSDRLNAGRVYDYIQVMDLSFWAQDKAEKKAAAETANYLGQSKATQVQDNDVNYDYYAVDQDGGLVPCYERGDSIEWVGTRLNTLLWEFTEYYYEGTETPNNYYELYNPYSEKYLAPQIGDGQILSDNPIGINLSGRRHGDYYTTIMAWDDPNYAYAGVKTEGDSIVSCPIAQAEEFYFAVMHKDSESDSLTEVSTIDHTQNGVTMRMMDYGRTSADIIKIDGTQTSREQDAVLGETVYDQWNPHHLLSTDLKENGYPDAVLTNRSLGELYEGARTVNNLFLEGVYNGTGYYEFDSTQNFASLQQNGDFKVYKELGTMDSSETPSLKHGQFMPYNTIRDGVYASTNGQNLYDASQNPLSDDDPRKYEQLYKVNNPNYYFGMELEASFVQTPNGQDAWGHDIIYEFTGDDDFWLYVDGELVIDLGGIHSALPGKVNYCTGEVEVNGTNTTLYEIFRKNYADRNNLPEDDQAVTDHLNEIFELNDREQL